MTTLRTLTVVAVSLACSITVWARPTRVRSEFQVNTYTTDYQVGPSVFVAGNGDFVVAWTSCCQQDGLESGVFARRYDSSGVALDTTDFQINVHTTSSQRNPSVGIAGNGDFVVTWQSYDQDGSLDGIFARRFASTGAPLDATEFQVNTYTTFSQHRPSVSVTPSGDFVVTWESQAQDGSSGGIFARRYDSSGVALDGADFQVNTHTLGYQFGPEVRLDGAGGFAVSWGSHDGDGTGIFARRFASTGAALDATDFQVNTYTSGFQFSPSIGFAPSGDFVVAWTSDFQDGSGYGIFARRYESSGAALDATEFQINSYTMGSQAYPSVSVAESGDFLVAWGGAYRIFGQPVGISARRFDNTGTAMDRTEFRVSKHSSSSRFDPAVGVSGSGDFVVTWWDASGQDGSDSGIFARQFKFVHLTNPLDGGEVDCRRPGLPSSRPLVLWDRGDYDRFRVEISWDPAFTKIEQITSGDDLLRRSWWRPEADEWRRFCNNEGGDAFIRVFGVDLQRGKNHPLRKTFSNEVTASVLN